MAHALRKQGILSGLGLALFVAGVHFVNDALTAMLGVLLPSLQARFGASAGQLAYLVGALWIASSIAQPALGLLAEQIGLRTVAALGVAVASLGFGLIGVAPSLGTVLALVILGGLGAAALHPAGVSMLTSGGGNRALAAGLFTAGGMLGFAAGPLLILALISRWGVESTPALMLPGMVLAVVLVWLAPDWEPHRGPVLPRMNMRLLLGPLGLLVIVSAAVALVFISMTSALPLWLAGDRGHATDSPVIAWSVAAFAAGAGLGAMAGGLLARHVGRVRLAATTLILAAGALFSVTFMVPGTAAFYLTASAGGALLYASNPAVLITAQEISPGSPASAAGMVLGMSAAVAGALYLVIGLLQDAHGIAFGMRASLMLLVPAAVLAASVMSSPRRRGLDLSPDF